MRSRAGRQRASRALIVVVVGLLAVLVSPAAGYAAASDPGSGSSSVPAADQILLTGPRTGSKHAAVSFTVTTLATDPETGASTVAAAGVPVVLEGLAGTVWRTLARATSDASGHARVTTTLDDRDTQTFRAGTAPAQPGEEPVVSAPLTLAAANQHSAITVNLAGSVKDGATLPMKIAWATSTGLPVPGRVQLHRFQQGSWQVVSTFTLNSAGTATRKITPRWDSSWYVSGVAGTWYDAATSARHAVDNIPPGRVVRYPARAPKPRVTLAAQPRATTSGAHPVVTQIPNSIWTKMVGVSWHSGCPVGRAGLRLLKINYWGFDGYRHQGQLIASTRAMKKFKAALVDLYRHHYPIKAMYLADHFGYSAATGGADDFAMMSADDTSAFNCRRVDNASATSPHSYGTAIDVNTWENPYRSATGIVPDAWWQGHSWAPITARKRSDLLVRIFARHGVRWTYGLGDTQHFDA